MREIKNECLGGGGTVCTSPMERDRGWIYCSDCGKVLQLRKGAGGLAVDRAEHAVPRHSRLTTRKRRRTP